MPSKTKIGALLDIPFGAFLLAFAVGALAGHLTYCCHEMAAFQAKAARLGYSQAQVGEWLNTGYITIDRATDARIAMGGSPINYGTYTHDEYLIYGALGGIAAGVLLAVAWVFYRDKHGQNVARSGAIIGAIARYLPVEATEWARDVFMVGKSSSRKL
ncbi:MAG: hypothetical protein AAGD11_09715 [Planctomycetota bacterium]